MLRLISFLSNHRNTLLFVLLEGIALFFIIRANDRQRHLLGDALFEVSAEVKDLTFGITDYFSLSTENRRLTSQNIDLQQQVETLQQQLSAYRGNEDLDSVRKTQLPLAGKIDTFSYIPAQVIKNATHRAYNRLTLNKGSHHGIQEGMGVVSPQGIVGRVIRVVDNYALVQSALNVSFELMVTALSPKDTLPIGTVGFFAWDGIAVNRAKLTYVPETVPLDTGYLVVTAGSSTIFPPGFKVGTIINLDQGTTTDGFYDADLTLATDFTQIHNVYVLKAPHKAVLDSLEQGLPTD